MAKKPSKRHNGGPSYRTYRFLDKDPIIDVMRTLTQDSKQSYADISDKSGVTQGTLYNWFHGHTKRPQFCTLNAVARACGKQLGLVNKGR